MVGTVVLPKLDLFVGKEGESVILNMTGEAEALKAHKTLIRSLAKKYAKSTTLAVEDLEQDASIAFIKAFRSWSPEGGQKLDVWAHTLIENELIKLAQRSSTESKYRTEPPPPSGRDEDTRHDPADRMDLMKSEDGGPEEQFAQAEERRQFVGLLSTLSPEDRAFLLEVREFGFEGLVRKTEGLKEYEAVPAFKAKRVERRAKRLEEQLVDAAKKWSA